MTIDEGQSDALVLRPSAAHAAREGDTAAQVAGYEIDAKIALAGPLAQLLSRPNRNDRAALAAKSHEDDFAQAKNAAVWITLLMTGESLPELAPGEHGEISLNAATLDNSKVILERLQQETKAILVEHWPAVKRVAKALCERSHLGQAELDRIASDTTIVPLQKPTGS